MAIEIVDFPINSMVDLSSSLFWHNQRVSGYILNNISATSPGMSGHLITMMRQPEQRLLSAYHDARFDHGASRYPNVCHADGMGNGSDFDGILMDFDGILMDFWWVLCQYGIQIYGHSLALFISRPQPWTGSLIHEKILQVFSLSGKTSQPTKDTLWLFNIAMENHHL